VIDHRVVGGVAGAAVTARRGWRASRHHHCLSDCDRATGRIASDAVAALYKLGPAAPAPRRLLFRRTVAVRPTATSIACYRTDGGFME
jgi:hypothetical protein